MCLWMSDCRRLFARSSSSSLTCLSSLGASIPCECMILFAFSDHRLPWFLTFFLFNRDIQKVRNKKQVSSGSTDRSLASVDRSLDPVQTNEALWSLEYLLTENRKETKPTNQPTKPCQIKFTNESWLAFGIIKKTPFWSLHIQEEGRCGKVDVKLLKESSLLLLLSSFSASSEWLERKTRMQQPLIVIVCVVVAMMCATGVKGEGKKKKKRREKRRKKKRKKKSQKRKVKKERRWRKEEKERKKKGRRGREERKRKRRAGKER